MKKSVGGDQHHSPLSQIDLGIAFLKIMFLLRTLPVFYKHSCDYGLADHSVSFSFPYNFLSLKVGTVFLLKFSKELNSNLSEFSCHGF